MTRYVLILLSFALLFCHILGKEPRYVDDDQYEPPERHPTKNLGVKGSNNENVDIKDQKRFDEKKASLPKAEGQQTNYPTFSEIQVLLKTAAERLRIQMLNEARRIEETVNDIRFVVQHPQESVLKLFEPAIQCKNKENNENTQDPCARLKQYCTTAQSTPVCLESGNCGCQKKPVHIEFS